MRRKAVHWLPTLASQFLFSAFEPPHGSIGQNLIHLTLLGVHGLANVIDSNTFVRCCSSDSVLRGNPCASTSLGLELEVVGPSFVEDVDVCITFGEFCFGGENWKILRVANIDCECVTPIPLRCCNIHARDPKGYHIFRRYVVSDNSLRYFLVVVRLFRF